MPNISSTRIIQNKKEMMKNAVISFAHSYNPEDVAPWINSLRMTSFDGDVIVLNFGLPQATIDFLQSKNVIIYDCQLNGHHIVVERFIVMYSLLKESEYDSILSTDMKDVIFQHNPFYIDTEYLPDGFKYKPFMVSSEAIKYKDEDWGRNNLQVCYGEELYETMKDRTIYNAGVICGKNHWVSDLFFHVYMWSMVGIKNDPQPDQAALNLILNTNPFYQLTHFLPSHHPWCCNLGTTLADAVVQKYSGKIDLIPTIQDGQVYTSNSKKYRYSIVHQWDRVAALKPIILEKYGLKK
jgi:hypothetical protein